jgi:hypothetical protein
MSSYSNYLIDSGYYEPTPEQERELIEARAENAAPTADGGKPCDTARATSHPSQTCASGSTDAVGNSLKPGSSLSEDHNG